MTNPEPPDRRKNPARKKASAIIYLVEQDEAGGRWNVTRNGVPTGAFARDKGTAIGQAYQAASLEQAGTAVQVTVWSVLDGKRTKEWPVG
jgi:hypothetical protein